MRALIKVPGDRSYEVKTEWPSGVLEWSARWLKEATADARARLVMILSVIKIVRAGMMTQVTFFAMSMMVHHFAMYLCSRLGDSI